jgi:hypothetical protein
LFCGVLRSVILCGIFFHSAFLPGVWASDWDEDGPSNNKTVVGKNKSTTKNKSAGTGAASTLRPESAGTSVENGAGKFDSGSVQKVDNPYGGETKVHSFDRPLEGKIEQAGESSLRIQRPLLDSGAHDPQSGSASSDALQGGARDGLMQPMSPRQDALADPLKGNATLLGGKSARAGDPDEDDTELMVEWDRWHNRFLRAVQLGTQEILNNPDTDDYERPHVDPLTGALTSRYPLGTGAAFSCQVTAEGQIKNLELIENSGFPRYDRAVLQAVRQLAGTQITHFPKGSHRRTVIQPGRIKTAGNSDFKYYKFGDVEKIRPRQ